MARSAVDTSVVPTISKKMKAFVAIAILASLLAIIDFCWSIYRTGLARFEHKPNNSYPSSTLEESKARGTFVAKLTVEPHTFNWDGKQVSINEIWLERKAERTGTLVIVPLLLEWPSYTIIDGYDLCFIPAIGENLPFWGGDAFFVQEGKGASFGRTGTLVWGAVSNPDFKDLTVLVANDWKFSKSVRLRINNPMAK